MLNSRLNNWWKKDFNQDYLDFYNPLLTPKLTKKQVDFVVKFLKPKSHVLDLGCGQGRHAVLLANKGFRVTAVDNSKFLISKAPKHKRVTYIQQDFRKPLKSIKAEGVICLFTSFGYHTDADNSKVLENVSRVLKKGGIFILDLPNPDRLLATNTSSSFVDKTNHWIYKREVKGKLYTSSYKVYSLSELLLLISRLRLHPFAIFGGFKGQAYSFTNSRLILVSKKV